MSYSGFWGNTKKQIAEFGNCLGVAIIGAGPGLLLYEINETLRQFSESQILGIALIGTILAETAYVAYSDKITKALGFSQSYQPYPLQQAQSQGR